MSDDRRMPDARKAELRRMTEQWATHPVTHQELARGLAEALGALDAEVHSAVYVVETATDFPGEEATAGVFATLESARNAVLGVIAIPGTAWASEERDGAMIWSCTNSSARTDMGPTRVVISRHGVQS